MVYTSKKESKGSEDPRDSRTHGLYSTLQSWIWICHVDMIPWVAATVKAHTFVEASELHRANLKGPFNLTEVNGLDSCVP
ncbi:hypothetical protein BTUL_0105g00380 [Botrytis tulipae]|uniref:Uncharacterized protein n=1 Tax=Botrytis tulipae TaxID=87230 RepID=A0A4Z1ELT5_9HELO|nr:hypothetical protein BTUL_0105g00380 [Botrytis tulipae]